MRHFGVWVLASFLWSSGTLALADTTFLQSPVDFTQLKTFLAARPDVSTVEKFLHELPNEHRAHYVLMHHSASLQGSSYEEPRVLSVTIDGNVALAFAGSDKMARGNTVEMWAFDRVKRKYDFREIVFDGKGSGHLSESNPALCLGCHGQDPRPIWGSYPLWKGAYAEYRPSGENTDPKDIQDKNRAFYEKQPQHPRYKEMDRYSLDEQSDRNVGFMHLLFETNAQRVGRLLMATPFYESYKYAVLGATLCLRESEDDWFKNFLPAPLAAQHRKAYDPAKHRRDWNPGTFHLFGYLFDARGVSTADWATLIDPLDKRSMSRFADTDPVDYEEQSPSRWAYGWALVDQEIGELADVAHPEGGGSVVTISPAPYQYLKRLDKPACAKLAEKSRSALGTLLKQHDAEEVFKLSGQASQRTPHDVLQSCASCHGATAAPTTPKIPFGDIGELSRWLEANPQGLAKIDARLLPQAGDKQMPPGNPLPEGERESLRQFLQALTKR